MGERHTSREFINIILYELLRFYVCLVYLYPIFSIPVNLQQSRGSRILFFFRFEQIFIHTINFGIAVHIYQFCRMMYEILCVFMIASACVWIFKHGYKSDFTVYEILHSFENIFQPTYLHVHSWNDTKTWK